MSNTKAPAARSPELEHAREATRREAEQLLSGAGSADHAQRAVDSAVGQSMSRSPKGDAFARQWKFGSYLEMFEASKPLATLDGKHWLATNVGADEWIVWNEQDLNAAYRVRSLDEAKDLVGQPNPNGDKSKLAPPTG
jgi:hypothetical protein